MDFKTFHLIPLDESSASFTQIFPTYSFREDLNQNKRNNISLAGELNTYRIEGFQYSYTLPLVNVSSDTSNKIETWWKQQRRLYLTINISETNTTLLQVRITNQDNPFNIKTRRNWNNYNGFIRLTSTQGLDKAEYTGLPFILDDPFWGLLDQTYNLLL